MQGQTKQQQVSDFPVRLYHTHGNFRGSYISWKASLKDFCSLIFAGHQVEYYCFLKPLLLFKDYNLALSKLTANSTKFTSLENCRVYGNY